MDKFEIIHNYVIDFIKNQIEPKGFTYHNLEHTLSVVERSSYLAKKEWLSKEAVDKIKTAAYFHDLWLVYWDYKDHENKSVEIFRSFNRKNKLFSKEEEDDIADIILATKMIINFPKKIEHRIIKDADLDNLWRDDFFINSSNLYNEFKNILKNNIPSFEEFLVNTYKNFKDFCFYTNTQKKERLAKWKENLNILKCLAEKGKSCFYFDKIFIF